MKFQTCKIKLFESINTNQMPTKMPKFSQQKTLTHNPFSLHLQHKTTTKNNFQSPTQQNALLTNSLPNRSTHILKPTTV